MTRRIVTVVSSLILMAAMSEPSSAGGPYPPNCTIPTHIRLVGLENGVVDPSGAFDVTLRGIAGDLMPNCDVEIDFSACNDVRVGDQGSQHLSPWDYMWVDGPSKVVRKWSGFSGVATFRIVGAALANRASGSGARCATIRADGILIGSVTVTAVDQDGVAGVGLSDLALLTSDYYSGAYFGRSDYDGSGAVTLTDISVWATDFYSGQSSQSSDAYAW
jgi:hypothetical protein